MVMAKKALTLLALSFLSTGRAWGAANQQPIELVSKNGMLDVTLTVDMVLSLNDTRLAPGYNGRSVGPTIRVKPGDTLSVTLVNNLVPSSSLDKELYDYVRNPDSDEINATIIYNRLSSSGAIYAPKYGFWGTHYMNLHFHGAEFDPKIENYAEALDGGESKTYVFEIPEDHPPGLNWYHNHNHGTAQFSSLCGLYGVLIVEGTDEDITSVPEVANATEIILMLAETFIIPETTMVAPLIRFVMDFGWDHVTNGYLGQDTTYTFKKGETVFFRTISGSVEPAYYLSIDNHTLLPLANDGHVVASLQETETVTIGAGARSEFMVKFDTPGTYIFRRGSWNIGISGPACTALFDIPFAKCVSFDTEKVVATIIVEEEDITATPLPKELPTTLPVTSPFLKNLETQPSVQIRTFNMRQANGLPIFQIPYDGSTVEGIPVGFSIQNDRILAPNSIAGFIEAGTCETWKVTSDNPTAGHTFHVHSVSYLVIELNGIAVESPVWRDTMPVMFNMTAHICFPRHTGLISVHCHMPAHLDIGMGVFMQISEASATTDTPSKSPMTDLPTSKSPVVAASSAPQLCLTRILQGIVAAVAYSLFFGM